jgi:predicted nucleotidyltransferase
MVHDKIIEIHAIVPILKTYCQGNNLELKLICIYGSWRYGTHNENSDIDIYVLVKPMDLADKRTININYHRQISPSNEYPQEIIDFMQTTGLDIELSIRSFEGDTEVSKNAEGKPDHKNDDSLPFVVALNNGDPKVWEIFLTCLEDTDIARNLVLFITDDLQSYISNYIIDFIKADNSSPNNLLEVIRSGFYGKADLSSCKATIALKLKNNGIKTALKSIFHSIRILQLAIQLGTWIKNYDITNKPDLIINWTIANDYLGYLFDQVQDNVKLCNALNNYKNNHNNINESNQDIIMIIRELYQKRFKKDNVYGGDFPSISSQFIHILPRKPKIPNYKTAKYTKYNT